MWQYVTFRRRTDPQSQVYSYRTALFKYRCYVVCGTATLHRQASTAVQQLVFENSIQNNVQNEISELVVVLNGVVVMCGGMSCVIRFDTLKVERCPGA